MKILIVDDEKELSESIVSWLRIEFFESFRKSKDLKQNLKNYSLMTIFGS